jgi:hypothetical protein
LVAEPTEAGSINDFPANGLLHPWCALRLINV